MPGIHLNDTERRLLEMWKNNGMPEKSLLGIEIHGNPGLRGISDLVLDFRYPVTVLCGKNGTGKTTLLSLAALGFHRFPKFHPKDAKIQKMSYDEGGYYTFNNFFYKGPHDIDCLGVNIVWKYKGYKTISINKRSEKWMHYERRPSRAVQYLGSARILSAIEQKTLRSHFKPNKEVSKKTDLSDEYLQYLSEILGRQYGSACDLMHESYHLRVCNNVASYSSFNMGAGEDAIIELLSDLQIMPEKSLCVIEEIELGIHPVALSKLAEVIQRIALKKKMQFIISSHSKDFIDSLPRQSRVLLQRFSTECQVIYEPTTRYAIGTISKDSDPDLYVYCEDQIAKKILKTILPNSTRKRINIVEIGGASEFKKVFDYHTKMMPRMKSLFIWDGDVTDNQISDWFGNVRFNYCLLHPENTPEYNILSTIRQRGINLLQSKLGFDSRNETSAFVEYLLSLKNLHHFVYETAQRTDYSEEEIINIFLDCYREIAKEDLANLANLIEKCLALSGDEFLQEHNR